jgi:hypothetical protein
MLDFIAEILGFLFGSKAEKEILRERIGIWSILLLILVILMGTYSLYYLFKIVISSSN